MAANMQSVFLCSMLVLFMVGFVSAVLNPDGIGKGVDHCKNCGATGANRSNAIISRCTLSKQRPNITESDFKCECREGFEGNGYTCDDFDECKAVKDNCDNNANCKNTVGSWDCICKGGYKGTGVSCTDINECEEPEADTKYCSGFGKCKNSEGSYTCGCEKGFYSAADETDCEDINECATNDGGCEQMCVNTPGSRTCRCFSGYEEADSSKPGVKCEDINECVETPAVCGANTHCGNVIGNYTCGCDGGYERADVFQRDCTDVDECAMKDQNNCTLYPNTKCDNLRGSFECICEPGYNGNKDSGCTDFNQCADPANNDCNVNADCTDKTGGFSCACKKGWSGNGKTCSDIDECGGAVDPCGPNSECDNGQGNFTCDCIYGFKKDGDNCISDGRDLTAESLKVTRSKALVQVYLLDHERVELELEHEVLLRRCAVQDLAKSKAKRTRYRREILEIGDADALAITGYLATLKKINGDLTLSNHALRLSCPK